MTPNIANVRKMLSTLILGVAVTLLAMLVNHAIYRERLPAMALGNRVLSGGESGKSHHGLRRAVAGALNISDDTMRDVMYTIRGQADFPPTRDQIAVIAIDEDSLIRRGSWPWPRSDIARLLEKVSDASVVGLDLVFPEPDPTSPINFVDSFGHRLGGREGLVERLSSDDVCLDNDTLLAAQISKTRAVLGVVLFDGTPPRNKPEDMKNNHPPRIVGPDPSVEIAPGDILLKGAQYALTDIACIRDVTPTPLGEGFMNVFASPRGIVRTVPVFAHVGDEAFTIPSAHTRRLAPSIVLEIFRVLHDGDGYTLHLRGDRVHIPELEDYMSSGDRWSVKGVSIERGGETVLTIPLNELAEMDVALHTHRDDYRVYPAWEVLEGRHDGEFRNKAVLLGSSVGGVGYVISSGLPDTEVSILDAHASMLSAMLKGDFMDAGYRDDYKWQQAAILLCGLAVTLAVILWDIVGGMLVALLSIVSMLGINYFLYFRRGLDVGTTFPILATLCVLAVMTGASYLMVGRERRFIRKAFQLNVSPSILGYLESHPDRLSSLQGDYRHMTVMFSDIRGFTNLSEKMTAPDLARFLNEYFTPMSDLVMRHSGTVDKFIGDGLMAFWNAPADNPNHARDAARTALDMLTRLEELQPGWSGRGLPRINIGCGINTGPMFAGYMGSEQRKNYTVMGDSVNIASRLEDLNKTYQTSVLITESTRSELGSDFVCRVVDKVRVSGKDVPIVIYELIGSAPASEETSEELAAFKRVFDLYQEREFVTAEALLKELVFIRPSALYKMYLDRLAIYKALPPPADWDGTFAMMNK